MTAGSLLYATGASAKRDPSAGSPERRRLAAPGRRCYRAGPGAIGAGRRRAGVRRARFIMYTKTLYAGWADMDFNSHMKNTAYLDKAADVRQMFLAENGFPIEEFLRLRIGPVVMKDEVEYFKEVGLQQTITVTYVLAGHSLDGSRFLLRHEIFRPDGKLSARVTSAGGWMDLAARKLIAPPASLLSAMNALERTSDFVELPSSIKQRV